MRRPIAQLPRKSVFCSGWRSGPPTPRPIASLAGVLVAASVVAVVRMAMRLGTNPAGSCVIPRPMKGSVERLAKRGGGLVYGEGTRKCGDFIV